MTKQQCLIREGYGSEQPPSDQTYLDKLGTADQFYAIATREIDPEFTTIIAKCPPPTWFLNLDSL